MNDNDIFIEAAVQRRAELIRFSGEDRCPHCHQINADAEAIAREQIAEERRDGTLFKVKMYEGSMGTAKTITKTADDAHLHPHGKERFDALLGAAASPAPPPEEKKP